MVSGRDLVSTGSRQEPVVGCCSFGFCKMRGIYWPSFWRWTLLYGVACLVWYHYVILSFSFSSEVATFSLAHFLLTYRVFFI